MYNTMTFSDVTLLRETCSASFGNQVAPDSRSDDSVFAELSIADKLDVCRLHAATEEDSVLRCYGAVKFLRSLDPCLLDVVDEFLRKDK